MSTDGSPLYTLIFTGIAAVGGAFMFFLGLRGKRTGDHPHCRTCGFDLFGLPANSDRCPECGANLLAKNATAFGAFRRRRKLIYAALLLIAACVCAAVPAAKRLVADGLQQHKPIWWLKWDAGSTSAARAAAADAEVDRRQAAGALSLDDITSLSKFDRDAAGQMRGAFIDPALASRNKMPPPVVDDLTRRMIELNVRTSTRIHAGDAINVRAEYRRSPGVAGSFLPSITVESVDVDKVSMLQVPQAVSPNVHENSSRDMTYTEYADPLASISRWIVPKANLPVGVHHGVCKIREDLDEAHGDLVNAFWRNDIDIPFTIQVVPDTQQLVTPIVTPALREELRSRLYARPSVPIDWVFSTAVHVGYQGKVPINLAFEAYLRTSIGEYFVGEGILPAGYEAPPTDVENGEQAPEGLDWKLPPGCPEGRYTLVLHPSARVAASRLGVSEMWGEDVVLPNVTVRLAKNER